MQQKTRELQQRTLRFAAAVDVLCRHLVAKRSANRLAQRLATAATAVVTKYLNVCTAASREARIAGLADVLSSAKRARKILQDLVALNHVPIESARDPIHEARALEAIFKASLETARRRSSEASALPDGAQRPASV